MQEINWTSINQQDSLQGWVSLYPDEQKIYKTFQIAERFFSVRIMGWQANNGWLYPEAREIYTDSRASGAWVAID